MSKTCAVCGEPARQSLGGVLLCAIHAAAIHDQIDVIRSGGGQVDVARLAHNMREPETPPQFAPSAKAVHSFLCRNEITGSQAARMMYLSGSRQVRKYTGGADPRQMDGARWFCLHAHNLLSSSQIAKIESAMMANAISHILGDQS